MIRVAVAAAVAWAAALAAGPAGAQPLSLRDSFAIGSSSQIVCTAQSSRLDPATRDIFDRGYAITCRDAAAPVGSLYVLRAAGDDPVARLAALRAARVDCATMPAPAAVEGLGGVQRLACRLKSGDVGYSVYLLRRGSRLYVAEGFSGYDSALQLGLRTLVANRPVAGDIQVATTGAGDPGAFARAQAGTLDPRRALEEAYRRNNSGAYAESGEFFGTLAGVDEPATRAEALVNQGLQASNLGQYEETEGLFARAAALGIGDPVLSRRLRNYTALHLLNQSEPAAALTELDKVIEEDRSPGTNAMPIIDRPLADRLTAEAPGRTTLDNASNTLTRAEKIQILDAQGMALRGTVLRLQGRLDAAAPLLRQAYEQLEAVRGGVVVSTIWMRSQIYAEEAAIAEVRRQPGEAERLYRAAVTLLETDYPGSSALLSARARLASYLARSGQEAPALALYHDIVAQNDRTGTGSAIVRRALEPYFALLTRGSGTPEAAADLFLAAQVLTRPGVAQTQAVLARELSAGSDEAARLFRQSVALTRDVERTRVAIARLETAEATGPNLQMRADLTARLADYSQAQTATESRLAAFPRFRVVEPGALTLAEMQALLRPGEAYYKLTVLDDAVYAVFATHDGARALRLATDPGDLKEKVDILRATIILNEDGNLVTYPFDMETARQLYTILFGPVASELAGVRHLVFEPDGPMLRLPPNLLVEDDASVARYRQRTAAPGADLYDFTGTAWFGRTREISTAVAPRAFRDVRAAGPSRATRAYLGFGQNAPATGPNLAAQVRGGDEMDADCSWSLGTWDHPIPAQELIAARNAIGQGGGVDIVTGAPFTDTAIMARGDLDQYRVVHFATHGLVTPPREGCPARPALLTSFGGDGSDGLLSFREVFDLHFDADLIILSACDTASSADPEAAAEAGVSVPGNYSFDGLVRAFVGAGGRMVLASHWQLPQKFDATERLVGGLFAAPPGTSTAGALAAAERRLMDAPATSHPYYWAGFAVVGDGETPVVRSVPSRSASSD